MQLTEKNPVLKILQEFLNNPGSILKIQRLSKSQLKVQNPYDLNGVKIAKSKSPLGCHQIKSSQSGWQYSLYRSKPPLSKATLVDIP